MEKLENLGCFIVFMFLMYFILNMFFGFSRKKKTTNFNYAEFYAQRQEEESRYNKNKNIEFVNSFDKESKSKKK